MSFKRIRSSLPFATAVALIILYSNAASRPAMAQLIAPGIDAAVVTTNTQPAQIAIHGSNFGKAIPTVTLDDINLVMIANTDTIIVAEVPDAVIANPGTYRLSITNNSLRLPLILRTGTMDVSIGAAGPEGPAGPAGPSGSNGSPGLPGPAGPAGLPGPAGPAGPTGPAGPQGAAGAPGLQGPAGAGLNWKGAWDSATVYGPNDAVQFNGSSYVNQKASSVGIQPDTYPAAWNLLAQQGALGPAGASGPAGPPGSSGPTGAQGPQGLQGPPGIQGQTGLTGLTGAQGPQGPAGPAGPPGGFSGYEVNVCSYPTPPATLFSGDCWCTPGKKPLSGGVDVGLSGLILRMTGSHPNAAQTGWSIDIYNNSATFGGTAILYVVCANVQ